MIGAYTSSFQMPLYDLGDIDDVGRRSGMCMTFCAIGAMVGPPISGVINNATGGFTAVGFYAGSGTHGLHCEPLTKPAFQEA
jgi:MCP family monocarboxylic acid transporter-like MFS transporter 10